MNYRSTIIRGSLVPQLVKNLPAMQETWVQSLGWEDPLEEGMATHSSMLFLCWCNCLLNGLIARNSESSQGFPDSSVGKEFAKEETPVQFLGQEDPLEKG